MCKSYMPQEKKIYSLTTKYHWSCIQTSRFERQTLICNGLQVSRNTSLRMTDYSTGESFERSLATDITKK